MKKAMILMSLFMVLLIFFGCAGSNKNSVPTSEEKGPTTFSEESLIGENDSIIYIYRVPHFVGALVSWNVRIDGKIVGQLRHEKYLVFHITPGVHTLRVGEGGPWLANAIVESVVQNPGGFKAKAGEIYYVRCGGFKVEFFPKEKAMEEIKLMENVTGK